MKGLQPKIHDNTKNGSSSGHIQRWSHYWQVLSITG